MTAEKIRIMLLEENRRQNQMNDRDFTALKARFDNKSREKEQCKHCKRDSHIEIKCRKLHSEQASQWAKDK